MEQGCDEILASAPAHRAGRNRIGVECPDLYSAYGLGMIYGICLTFWRYGDHFAGLGLHRTYRTADKHLQSYDLNHVCVDVVFPSYDVWIPPVWCQRLYHSVCILTFSTHLIDGLVIGAGIRPPKFLTARVVVAVLARIFRRIEAGSKSKFDFHITTIAHIPETPGKLVIFGLREFQLPLHPSWKGSAMCHRLQRT